MKPTWRRDCQDCESKAGGVANLPFSPWTETEAKTALEQTLHESPFQHSLGRTRWRLQDVSRAVRWLAGYSDAGVYKLLKRLGFSRKQALQFILSPDPNYRFKWQRILLAYQEAWTNPDEVVLLFQDELTYYRRARLKSCWQKRGGRARRHYQATGPNTKARVTATLNAVTGEVLFLQRSKIGLPELAAFYAQLRQAYPTAKRIYLVQDNWPPHKHPTVRQALEQHELTPLFLPTYASWLNPIEKLWRWLRQDILHNHDAAQHFKLLRQRVVDWLAQFSQSSPKLLLYVGILTPEEVPLYQY